MGSTQATIKYYTTKHEDPTDLYKKKLTKIVKSLPSGIRDWVFTLIPTEPKVGYFYMLLKIYKEGNPGRCIISGIGMLIDNTFGWVENISKSLVCKTPSPRHN